ncbi:MAG: UDP-N-acetylmuramoyl-L-alanine--D-glutamate ligase [Campylobacterales bacterium]
MTLFGYGSTTRPIAAQFAPCDIFDDRFTEPSIDAYGNRLLPPKMFDPEASELEVTSPGIAPSHPLIQKARHLISDYDLFFDRAPFQIWISGTNGKTTTTQMTQWLLESRGSVAGGNLGTPVASLDPHASLWILETSSFTIHYTTKAHPGLYLLLPITPDHITWHGGMEAYEAAKLKPLTMMEEGSVAIVPARYANYPTLAHLIDYEDAADLAAKLGIDPSPLRFNGVFLLDAIMALAAQKILFDDVNYERINQFVIDGHRQEEFVDARGRLWVDDSKATNLDATIEAVKNYAHRPIHLILGGDDKGADLSELFAFLQGRALTIYAVGSNAAKIVSMGVAVGLEVVRCDTLDKAVEAINLRHDAQSVALLSPAAASLDQFSSYKERGEKFKAFVANLS